MRKGVLSIGVAVIMMILLTVALGTIISCGNSLSSLGDKKEYIGQRYRMKSSHNLILLKLERTFEIALQETVEDIHKAHPMTEELDPESLSKLPETFQERFTFNFYDKNAHRLQREIEMEDFEGMSFGVKQFTKLQSQQKIFLSVESKNYSYSKRNRFTVDYTIQMILPDSEDMKYIGEKDIHGLTEKYRQYIQVEMAYSDV